MRVITDQLKQKISQNTDFIYCFEISLLTGGKLYLNSSCRIIYLEGNYFLPSSGLNITSGEFNDSACNYITLEGIFEAGGITTNMDIAGAIVKIIMYFGEEAYHLVTYECSLYTKYDLSFKIYLEPELKKYNQSLLQEFSKTCRANFGDSRCKINKKLYNQLCDIIEINDKILIIKESGKENGYFDNGEAFFSDEESFSAKILKHNNRVIELDRYIPDHLKHNSKIILVTSCDKKFITCCNKFNNAVNFRGEPFIPEDNFLSKLL